MLDHVDDQVLVGEVEHRWDVPQHERAGLGGDRDHCEQRRSGPVRRRQAAERTDQQRRHDQHEHEVLGHVHGEQLVRRTVEDPKSTATQLHKIVAADELKVNSAFLDTPP